MSRDRTTALFFPFDLFGSSGAAEGVRLLAEAFAEMLEDNRRESRPTRAAAYQRKVRSQEVSFSTLADYSDWRQRGRNAVRGVWDRGGRLLYVAGNHLGVLPLYDELAGAGSETLVIQFDAHLDIYNLSDCTADLSHGNFLLHGAGPLPRIFNLGHRELLLRPEYVARYYEWACPAAELALDPAAAVQQVRTACGQAERVIIDIDCDVLDPAFFPALSHPLPLGLSPHLLLRFLEAAWSERVRGVALSEFDPGRDRGDRSLATLLWLVEYLLLRWHERSAVRASPRRHS